MRAEVFEAMARHEREHWWFAARRSILAALIESLFGSRRDLKILDAGCGTGGNLELLTKFGSACGFEPNDFARLRAEKVPEVIVRRGSLPDNIPSAEEHFDLITVLDVLEHVEQDTLALTNLAVHLRPGGYILATAPAVPALWSSHDTQHHHFRRYTRASLSEVARRAGLRVERSGYFNTLLLPVAVMIRLARKLANADGSDDVMPPAPVNRLLFHVFALERHIVPNFTMPVGLSTFVVLRRY